MNFTPWRKPVPALMGLLVLAGSLLFLQCNFVPSEESGAARGSSAGSTRATKFASTDPAVCAPDSVAAGTGIAAQLAANQARENALAGSHAFTDWLTKWRRADQAGLPALVGAGVQVAADRRAGLKYLIQTDPRRALDLAVPVGLRAELPAEVQAQLEQRLDARGDLEVSVACLGTETWTQRTVKIADQYYQAYVFGRREQQTTKYGLPLHGIAVDGVAAFEETPYRVLDDGEKSSRGVLREKIAILIGSEVNLFDTRAELTALEQRLIAAESAPGPHLLPSSRDAGDHEHVPGTAAVTSPASWIIGDKRVLWINAEFADDPGAAAVDTDITATGTAVNTFYQDTSHGRTSMNVTILPALLRLPKDKAYYNGSSSTTGELQDAAKLVAKQYDAANGNTGAYDPDRFDRYITLIKKVPAYTFGGIGNLGGPRILLNNAFGASTAGHELGHTQSLDHSHAWLPSTSSPIGPGTHVEYGDVFDRMGTSGSGSNNFFNVAQKVKLGYLDDASVTTVTAAGTYRLTRHDHKDAIGIRALKVGASNVEYEYWIEHRQLGPAALTAAQLDRLQKGVILHWGPAKLPKFVSGPGSYLLDMTPGSAAGTNDAPLRIGETFTDPDAGITIQPLVTGGTAPNEYIDVQVSFGAVNGNRNPTLIADPPVGPVAARTNLVFTASATDADGDPVYYRWDFGDRSMQPNLATVSNRYLKGGTYPVNVSAHDGKGGITVKSYTLNVTDPLTTWTRRGASVSTIFLNDVTFAGGKFVAIGDSSANLTSPDGITWTRGTAPSGFNLRGVAYSGSRYAAVGFLASNPATDKGVALRSDDGVTWTTATIPSGSGQLLGLAFGAGRFVAVGELGRIYSSTDAITWSAAPTPVTSTLRTVIFTEGLFVVVGDAGRVFTSLDGLGWANRTIASTANFAGVARHNGAWYMNGGATVYTSADTVTWSRVATSNMINLGSYKAYSVGGVLLGGFNEGTVQFSENAQSWASVQIDATANYTIRGAAEGKGVIVAVGNSGIIYTASSPAQLSPPLAAPFLRLEADSLKLSVGRKNIIPASGSGYAKLELYANGTKVSEISGQSGFFTWTPSAIGNYALTIRGVNIDSTSAVSASYPAQAALASWNWRNPAPAGADLNGAARVDGKWWIVGNAGTFFTLDTAGNVTPVDFSTTQRLTSIAYANGRFVVTAPYSDAGAHEDIGSIWTSTNGYNWTPLLTTTIEAINLNYVTYAGGQWLALSTGGTALTSTDGLVWSRQNTTLTVGLNAAAYGNGLYVIAGSSGKIATSRDGFTWTERTSGVTTILRGLTFTNGNFVAVGDSGVILTSTDGVAWVPRTSGTTNSLFGAGVVKGAYVVAGNAGTVLTSDDGITWAAATVENRLSAASVVIGAEGEGLIAGRAGEFYTSSSASVWKRANFGTSDARTAVINSGGRFVAVGQSTDLLARNALVPPVAFSADGVTWTRANANPAFGNLNDLTYEQQLYVAVGDGGRIFTSPDAQTWTQRTSGSTAQLNAAGASPTTFVAAGAAGAILTSADGIAWNVRTSGTTNPLRGAAFGGGRFVVVGDNGTVLSSADGTAWTAATSGVTASLLNVSWFDNLGFLAAGNSGTMIGSTDGVVWRTIESGITDNITAIAQTPIGYVAPAGTSGTLLVSLDGNNWSIATVPAGQNIRGIAASASSIVATGDNGALLTFDLVDPTPAPTITSQPASQAVTPGSTVRLGVSVQNSSGGSYQWIKDGTPLVGANSPTYVLSVNSPANAGLYAAVTTNVNGSVTSQPAILGLSSAVKLIGTGTEFPDIFHAGTGFTYDQVLLGGAAASVTADPGQILRMSFIDLNDDIVQVEFSGAGTLSLVLDSATGPAAPQKYNQTTTYMKGHAGIVMSGANATTNLSVFSVGRANAANQSLFRSDLTYDGFADLAFIAITSTDGKFGGLRAANASFFAAKGYTGIYAPNIQFTGPVFVSDINASNEATPVLALGSGTDVRITGGDLLQTNDRAVQVSGIPQLKFTAGSNSHGTFFNAQSNRARLEQNGVDVTAQIVVNPTP